MPADPIPIGSHPPTQPRPMANSPPQAGAPALSSSTPGSLFANWKAFSSSVTNKSPTNANVSINVVGSSPPTQKVDIPHQHHEDHDSFDHDSLEFGDLTDLKNRGWAAANAARERRTVSMSLSPTQTMGNPAFATSPGNSAVLNDKMAYGNGVLRRLSLSSGFTRPPVSAVPNPPNPTPIGSVPINQQGLGAHPPPPPDLAATTPRGAAANGRRRFSESGARKRGVSPMGERLLRDQVHF